MQKKVIATPKVWTGRTIFAQLVAANHQKIKKSSLHTSHPSRPDKNNKYGGGEVAVWLDLTQKILFNRQNLRAGADP